jgi:hypothetical protein
MFLPPWPKITAAVPSAREIVVGDVVATFDPSQLHTADGGPRTKALLVTEEIRGDRKVGDLVDIQYLLPNWPWGRSSDQTAPYPSCSYLQALPGERIAIAFGAIHPRGPVTSGDFTWIQPRTTYDAMGVVIAKPPSAGWGAGRQHVTVAELRRLAALPATDAVAPSTELTPAMPWPLLVVVGIVAGIVVLRRRSSDPQTNARSHMTFSDAD